MKQYSTQTQSQLLMIVVNNMADKWLTYRLKFCHLLNQTGYVKSDGQTDYVVSDLVLHQTAYIGSDWNGKSDFVILSQTSCIKSDRLRLAMTGYA